MWTGSGKRGKRWSRSVRFKYHTPEPRELGGLLITSELLKLQTNWSLTPRVHCLNRVDVDCFQRLLHPVNDSAGFHTSGPNLAPQLLLVVLVLRATRDDLWSALLKCLRAHMYM